MDQLVVLTLLQKMEGCGMKINKLKKSIIKDLQKALVKKDTATLVLSGGSTPKQLFTLLSKTNIAWGKVTILLCDERCVNTNHKDSNEKLVKTYLLKNYAKKAKFFPLYENNKQINSLIKQKSLQLKSFKKFDVVILGMGDDGHTASLFPNNKKLVSAYTTKKACIHITPLIAPYERISLTKKALLNSHHIYLHTNGEEKKEVLQKAKKDGNIYTYPILNFLDTTIKVYQL